MVGLLGNALIAEVICDNSINIVLRLPYTTTRQGEDIMRTRRRRDETDAMLFCGSTLRNCYECQVLNIMFSASGLTLGQTHEKVKPFFSLVLLPPLS